MYLTQCQFWLPSFSYPCLFSCQVMFVTKELSAFFFFFAWEVLLTSEQWWWLSYSKWGSNLLPLSASQERGARQWVNKVWLCWDDFLRKFISSSNQSVTHSVFEDSPRICVQHWQQPSLRAFSGRMLWNRLVRAQGTTDNVYVSGQK